MNLDSGLSEDRIFMLVLGTNHTGKTHLLRSLLGLNDRNLIIPSNRDDPAWQDIPELFWLRRMAKDKVTGKKFQTAQIDELNTFKGNRKVIITSKSEMVWDRLLDEDRPLRRAGFFIDDFSNRITPGTTIPKEVTTLFSSRRHRKLDIFMATHSLKKVNPDLLEYNPLMVIKNITRPITSEIKNKVANWEELKEKAERVRRIAEGKEPGVPQDPYYYELFRPNI